MSRSPTITDDNELLHNPSAGDILASEFIEPLTLAAEALAAAIQVSAATVQSMIDGTHPVDAELDLRLGRYLGMSEGFFLRLQNAYDLEEAKRTRGDAIERITRRAA